MGCNCGKPKCNGECGCKSPKVLQINNPAEYITFHKVNVPAAMGDSKTNPPAVGKYKNVLLYYEADQTSWIYSTDGIPVKLTNGITNYEDSANLPEINGHTLIGNKTSHELGLQGELTAGDNIQIEGNTISATDTTYTAGDGIEIDGTEVKAKIGDGLKIEDSETVVDMEYIYNNNLTLPTITLNRIYREIVDQNHSGLTTYDPDQSGAAGVQGGVSTGDGKMLFTYWNGDDQSLNENRIVEKNITTGQTIKEVSGNYGWCNGLAYNQDKGLVYVIPRGKQEGGSNVWLKDIVVLNYSDLSYVDTVTLGTDMTIQSAYYSDGELWVMAEGAEKFYRISTEDYSILETVTLQIPSSNSTFYYQNFAYFDEKFWILGSLPRALMAYDKNGVLCKQYSMPTGANGLYNVGEYQFIGYEDEKIYIGSSQSTGVAQLNQVFLIDLRKGFIQDRRYNGAPTNLDVRQSFYVDASSTGVNPDGTESNPFKEIFEATMTPDRNCPARIFVSSGQYKHVNMRGLRNYSLIGTTGAVFTINGLYFRECSNFVMFNANIADSTISSQEASINIRNSSVVLRNCSVASTSKYACYLMEGAVLDATRDTTMSTATAMPNVYVDTNSELKVNTSLGITFRKAALSSIINTPMALFPSDQTDYLGDFALSPDLSSWYSKDFFNFISVDYSFKQTRKIVKFPTSLNQICITDSYTDGSGNTFLGKVYVGINASNKIVLSTNSYVKIENNSDTAAISRSVLADNESGSDSYIAIKNVYLSDN